MGDFDLVWSFETVGLQAGSLRKEVMGPGEEAIGRAGRSRVGSLQAARTPGIALVRRLQPDND
jgi:hypothetical protein